MPTLLNENGFRFYFYSKENAEPCHVHVAKGSAAGKIWLEPSIEVAYLYQFTNAEEKDIMKIVVSHAEAFKKKWYEHFQ